MKLVINLNPSNLIPTMLASKDNWDTLSDMIRQSMRKKEAEERRRQATVPI